MNSPLKLPIRLLLAGLSLFIPSAALAQLDPDASYVEISYEGPVDSFSQSGSLQHDGSIGPDVPIYMSAKIFEPDWENWTINERESSRSASILVEINFQYGNYSATETKSISAIQFLSSDIVRFDIGMKPTQSTFTGTLFNEGSPIDIEELRFGNSIDVSLFFGNQGATLENVWGKLVRGEANLATFGITWQIGNDSPANRIDARVYAGGRGWNATDPGDPFAKEGFAYDASSAGVSLNLETTTEVPTSLIKVEPSSYSGYFLAGEVVELSAPDGGRIIFTGWTGDVSGIDNPILVTMDENKSLLANFDPSSRVPEVEISYEGPVDSFSQSGSLQHDGSIGPDVPIYFSAKIQEPDFENWAISERGASRSAPIEVEINFQYGNYSASETKSISIIEFPDSELVRVDIDLKPTSSTFIGTLFSGGTPIDIEELRFSNSISISVFFGNQGATLENFWGKLVRGEANLVIFEITWQIGNDSPANRIDARVYAGGRGWNVTDPGDPFAKEGFAYDASSAGVSLNIAAPPNLPSEIVRVEPGTFSGYYQRGQNITLSTSEINGLDFNFSGWSGDIASLEDPLSIALNSDTSITANFGDIFQLLVLVESPEEIPAQLFNVDVSPGGVGGLFPSGQEVILTANEAGGLNFQRWSGSISSTTNPLTIVLNEDSSITAIYERMDAEILDLSGSGQNNEGAAVLAWEPVAGRLFASLLDDDRTPGALGPLVELNPDSGEELARIDIAVSKMATTPNGNELWVVNEDGSQISIIDVTQGSDQYFQVVHTIETGLADLADIPEPFNLFISEYNNAYFFSSVPTNHGHRMYDLSTKERVSEFFLPEGEWLNLNDSSLSTQSDRLWLGGLNIFADVAYFMDIDPSAAQYNTLSRGALGRFVDEENQSLYTWPYATIEIDELQSLFVYGQGFEGKPDRLNFEKRSVSNYAQSERLFNGSGSHDFGTDFENLGDYKILLQTSLALYDESVPESEQELELIIYDLEDETITHRIPIKGVPHAWEKGGSDFFFLSHRGRILRVNYSEPQPQMISVEPSWTVSPDGEELEIPVIASNNAHWQAILDPRSDWLQVEEDWRVYSGSDSFTVSIDENLTTSSRTSSISVSGNEVTIHQPKADDFVILSHESVEAFPAVGGSTVFNLLSNIEWSVSTDVDWVSIVSETNGLGNGWIEIELGPNNSVTPRVATIRVNDESIVIMQSAGPPETVRTPTGGSSQFGPGIHEVDIAGRPALIMVGENYDPATPTVLAYYLHGDEGGYDFHTSVNGPVSRLINEEGWVYVAPLAPPTGDNFKWDAQGNSAGQEANRQQIEAVLDFMFTNFNVYREHVVGAGASGGSWFHDLIFFPLSGQTYPSYFNLNCGAGGMREGGFNYNAAVNASQDETFRSNSELRYTVGTEDFLFDNATISVPTYAQLGFSVSIDFREGVGHCDFLLEDSIADYWREKALELGLISGNSPDNSLEVIEGTWQANPDTIGWLYGQEGSADMHAVSTQFGNIYHPDFPWIYDYEWGWLLFVSREGEAGPVHYYHADLGNLTLFDESAVGWFYSWDLNEYDNFLSPKGRIPLPSGGR